MLKGIVVAGLTAILVVSMAAGALALDGTYGKGKEVGKGEFASGTYAITASDTLYQYATGKDGNAYYTTYDGETWAAWSGWESQPTAYKGDPAPVAYHDESYVTYHGDDGKYYLSENGGEWTDISGDYTFKYAPYVNVYDDIVYFYGVAEDGYVYWKDYNGSEWGEWGEIGGQTTSAYAVYAVDWNDYNNVLWTGDDGNVYWNRWDGSAWSGTKELTNGATLASTPYAVGYAPEEKLYAYSVTDKGQPAWNVFTEGEGWTGWTPYEGLAAKVTNKPNAYVYEDIQHVVYTGEDGHAYYTEYDGAWADEWTDLGNNYAYDSYQYAYEGDLYVTYTGEDYSVYVKEYESASGY
jgi:hypothetical protein